MRDETEDTMNARIEAQLERIADLMEAEWRARSECRVTCRDLFIASLATNATIRRDNPTDESFVDEVHRLADLLNGERVTR